ncbi:uncharacterized protein KY384_007550 [Bacidia gigantensis]|uniref:uncharacterized protein n=1 Tax=Bacidia gigantensis TaxID=2732470 RepID=UPI001D04BC1A|nr:uncharacterized protein KY384_007550 [Bacidia gigantensis]KAG8527398.1 hypothetical protein KY384_007550 [Bacidia gigantensis]
MILRLRLWRFLHLLAASAPLCLTQIVNLTGFDPEASGLSGPSGSVSSVDAAQYEGPELGINCRGDWLHCWGADGILDAIINLLPKIDDKAIWEVNSHIICFRATGLTIPGNAGFCLFMQGGSYSQNLYFRPNGRSVAGVDGASVKRLMPKLREHGCNSCSSIPLAVNNNPSSIGQLTINYVHDRRGCDALICDPTFKCSDPNNPYNQWALYNKLKANGTTPDIASMNTTSILVNSNGYLVPVPGEDPKMFWMDNVCTGTIKGPEGFGQYNEQGQGQQVSASPVASSAPSPSPHNQSPAAWRGSGVSAAAGGRRRKRDGGCKREEQT